MSCPCAYEPEDCDEASTIWRERPLERRTRKNHRCEECGDQIPKGSLHGICVVDSLYDGLWDRMYRCASCSTYAEYISAAAKLCPPWGHLSDFVTDNDLGWETEDEAGNEIWEGLPKLWQWRERDKESIP